MKSYVGLSLKTQCSIQSTCSVNSNDPCICFRSTENENVTHCSVSSQWKSEKLRWPIFKYKRRDRTDSHAKGREISRKKSTVKKSQNLKEKMPKTNVALSYMDALNGKDILVIIAMEVYRRTNVNDVRIIALIMIHRSVLLMFQYKIVLKQVTSTEIGKLVLTRT